MLSCVNKFFLYCLFWSFLPRLYFFFLLNTALSYGNIETLFLGKRAISVWSLKISKYSFVKFLAKRGRARNGRSDAWPPFVISSNVSLPRENKIIQGFDWFWLRRNKICRHKNDLFSLPFPMGHRLVHSELWVGNSKIVLPFWFRDWLII